MQPAIRVDQLGKSYRVAHDATRAHYKMLREAITASVVRPFRRLFGNAPPDVSYETFWALKDVNFEIKPGEVVGIIGRNGAGKSTLLKVLSRITKPTTGRVEINGRIGSLLEVGTGFHPELTGRENVFLNGSLLGMKRREIAARFDEIVAFAEIEQFLDTPVKRYSSGMYVRLAFAVAAHLDPEILIVDEVLAVGDTAFQKKCLGKMEEIHNDGRTLLFVSHNVTAIQQLTQKCVLLNHGSIQAIGPTSEMVHQYLDLGVETGAVWERRKPASKSRCWINAIRCLGPADQPTVCHRADKPFKIEIEFECRANCRLQVAYRLLANLTNEVVFSSTHGDGQPQRDSAFAAGRYVAHCTVPGHLLAPGLYAVLVALINVGGGEIDDLVDRALCFEINTVGSLASQDHRLGIISPLLPWQLHPLAS